MKAKEFDKKNKKIPTNFVMIGERKNGRIHKNEYYELSEYFQELEYRIDIFGMVEHMTDVVMRQIPFILRFPIVRRALRTALEVFYEEVKHNMIIVTAKMIDEDDKR